MRHLLLRGLQNLFPNQLRDKKPFGLIGDVVGREQGLPFRQAFDNALFQFVQAVAGQR